MSWRANREDEGGEERDGAVDHHGEDFILGESAAEAKAYLDKAIDGVSQQEGCRHLEHWQEELSMYFVWSCVRDDPLMRNRLNRDDW